MIIDLVKQFKNYYHNSFFVKNIKTTGSKITSAWNDSIIGSFFIIDTSDEAAAKSSLLNALATPFLALRAASNKTSDFIRQSCCNSRAFYLAKMHLYNSLTLDSRFYGSMLMAFGLGGIVFDYGFGIGFAIRCVTAILGMLLFLFNRPIITWIKESLTFRISQMIFGFKIEMEKIESMKGEKSAILGTLNGLLMAASGLFLPSFLTPAVFVLLTGFIMVLWRFEVGAFLLVFAAPLLPTMACAALAVLTIISYIIRCLIEKRAIVKFDAVSLLIFIFMVLLGFYAITSLSLRKSVQIFALYAVFISMYFVIVNTITNKKRLYWIVTVFLASGLIVSLYGIYQQFLGSNEGHAWIDEDMFEEISVRVYSTLENPNVLGEYLLFVIPLAMAMVLLCKGILSKLYYVGILACSALCLVFTQSRGCWIGIMFGLFVYIFLINKRYLSFLFIALIIAPFILPTAIIERFTSIGNIEDTSTSYRVFIWFGTLAMLKDFWPYGLGLGEEAFNRIYPFYSYSNIYAPHSHNIYLQLITETGIVGFSVMISMLILLWRRLIGSFIRYGKSHSTIIGVALLSSSLAFMLQGAFDYVWYNYRVFLMFWMMLAVAMAANNMAKVGDKVD